MPPVTPSRIRAMRKVCLRAGQEAACGFEVALVHDHSRRACHRDAACKRRDAGRNAFPAVVALDAVRPQHPQSASASISSPTTVSVASAISSKPTVRPERKPKAYVEANRERGGRRPHREHGTTEAERSGLTWGSRSSEDPRRLLPSPS